MWQDDEENATVAQKLHKHRHRYVRVQRTIEMVYASTLIGVLECVPLGILQIMYALKIGQPEVIGY